MTGAYEELCALVDQRAWRLELHADLTRPGPRRVGRIRELTALSVTAENHEPLSVDIDPPNEYGIEQAAVHALARLETAA